MFAVFKSASLASSQFATQAEQRCFKHKWRAQCAKSISHAASIHPMHPHLIFPTRRLATSILPWTRSTSPSTKPSISF